MAQTQAQSKVEKIEDFKKLQVLTHEAELKAELLFREKLLNIYNEAAIYKQQITANWDMYKNFVRGAQWPSRRPSYKVSAVVNFIIENVERKTALLTDAKPIPFVVPRSDKYQDTADILNAIISVIFQEHSFGLANADLVENAQVFGSGFLNTVYNKDSKEVLVCATDPRAIYIDPLVRKSYLLVEGEYVIIEDVWSLSRAQDMYPKRADMLRPDAGLSRFRTDNSQGMFQRMMNKVFKTTDGNLSTSEIPRVYVREYWLKDRSKNDEGKARFKNAARKVVMIGEVIVDDGDNPYLDGDFTTDMLAWHTDFDSCWGWGDVELMKSPQEIQMKLLATVVENATLMSNAIWVGDADALSKEEWTRLNNAPGTHVKKRPGRELRREPGVPLPSYVMDTNNYMEIAKEKITGMVDVMRGIRTGQVSSGVGIESLQMMAQALVRLRARALEAMHQRVGRKLVSRIFQFYEPEKIFEFLRATSADMEQDMKEVSSELLKPISSRSKTAWKDVALKIEPGSSLGLAKTQRQIQSMRLREMQVIDDQALLEDIEYPHREKVLARVKQKREDETNQEIAGQQPPQGGGRGTQFPGQAGGSPKGRF
uniref:Putative head to tail joining protein n=1 Tax=viral metagenome TaxID=1070528 RepID=A0A6M3KIA4_9ZZZZ